VGDVLNNKTDWPLLGPGMRKSGDSRENLFHLGPIYYYFQISSAKIFGNDPEKMAYPDLFFSILSIPLLFVFLRKCFNSNVALSLAGLYTISFFSIVYSRFAWNPNLIPFFTVLFLLSLFELLSKKEKTSWGWIILSGISIGVGMQLHVVLLVLFPVTAFFVFIYLLNKNRSIWKELVVIIFIAVVLNVGYLISEYRTDFSNSKILLKWQRLDEESFLGKFVRDVNCHAGANFYMLSAYGSDRCDFAYSKLLKNDKSKALRQEIKTPGFVGGVLAISIFSLLGYYLLFQRAWKEKDENKKYFLGLISLYSLLFFLIMLPIVGESFASFRYFGPIFFIPFIFLGLFIEFIVKKLPQKHLIMSILIFSFFAITNINSIKNETENLQTGEESDIYYHVGILGEFEPIVKYLINNNADDQKNIYISGDRFSLLPPLSYLATRQNFNIVEFNYKNGTITSEKPLFYITDQLKDDAGNYFVDYKIKDCKKFGKIIIYKLEK
jgi:hypothetical protein